MSEAVTILTGDDILVEEYRAARPHEDMPCCYVDEFGDTQTLRSLLAKVENEIRAHGPDAVVDFDSGYGNLSITLTEAVSVNLATARMGEKRRKAQADAVARKHSKLKAQLKKLGRDELKALITSLEN